MQFTSVFVATLLAAVASARAVAPVDAASVKARDVCPNPFSSCQYADGNECIFGYAACLQKFGCSNSPSGADCIAISLGCAVACP